MTIRLSEATQEDVSQPTRLNTVRLGSLYNPTNVEFATINNPESVDVQKNRGLWEQTKTFFGEVGKSFPRGTLKIPATLEAGWQGIIDNLRNDAKNRAAKAGAVFGISDEKFNARTPEQQKIIDNANREILSLNRAEEVSKNLRQEWINSAEKIFPRDPEVFRGSFTENPSWARAVSLGMESAPQLGIAAAITAITKNPLIGASTVGVAQGAEERLAAKEAGASTETANNVFLANAIVGSALENIPLTKFLKGGSLPLKAFEKGIGKKVSTAIEVGATEATEEGLQQIWSNAVAKIGYDNTRNLTEGLVESIVAGGVSGGLIGSFSPARAKEINGIIIEAKNAGVDVDKMIEVVGKQIKDNGDAISGAILDKVNTYKQTEIPMQQGARESLAKVEILPTQGAENAKGTGKETFATSQEKGVVKEKSDVVRVRDAKQIGDVKQKEVISNVNISPDNQATSVISYVTSQGEKVYTKITKDELKNLFDEVKNIPMPKSGESQIHLDAITPNLLKVGKEVSRQQFIEGHSQAQQVLITANKPIVEIKGKEQDVIKVPSKNLPVGEGKQKASRLAERIQEGFKNVPESVKNDILSYKELSNKKQIERASEYIINNEKEAMEVLEGKRNPPDGLLYNSIFIAMRQKAVGNPQLITDLASLQSTRFGQEISILREVDPNDAVTYVQELQRKKIEAYGDNELEIKKNIKNKKAKELKNIIKEIKKKASSKDDWSSFIQSIKCK